MVATPEELPAVFEAAFNRRDIAALRELFADSEACGVVEQQLASGPVTLMACHAVVQGAAALLTSTWIDARGETYTVSNVLRRGDDGGWRYLVDDLARPTQPPAPAHAALY